MLFGLWNLPSPMRLACLLVALALLACWTASSHCSLEEELEGASVSDLMEDIHDTESMTEGLEDARQEQRELDELGAGAGTAAANMDLDVEAGVADQDSDDGEEMSDSILDDVDVMADADSSVESLDDMLDSDLDDEDDEELYESAYVLN